MSTWLLNLSRRQFGRPYSWAQFLTLVGSLAVVSVFLPAAASAQSSSTARPGLLTEVPFSATNNWIILDVKIGTDFVSAPRGPTLHFLLDTGASGSVLTKEALDANKLNLGSSLVATKIVRAEGAGDSGGIVTNQSVRAAVRIGDLQFVNALAVFPLGDSLRRLGVDGIIGNDVLRSFVTEVDYVAHKVRFYDGARFQEPAADAKFWRLPLQFRESDGLPFVDAEITPFGFSATDAHITLDTGDDRCLTLYTPYVERQRWQDALPKTVPANYVGVGGNGTGIAGRLRSVTVGDTTLSLPPVVFTTSRKGALAGHDTDGQFGGLFLSRFTVILDYGHSCCWLRRNDLATSAFPQLHYFGYSASPPATVDGGYRIDIVEPGSPAEQVGIRVGDILYKIGDISVANLDSETLARTLQQAGTSHSIEIGAGKGEVHRHVTISGVAY